MKTVALFLSVLFVSSMVFAETIHLTDGRTIEGKVLQKNDKEVKVDLNGMTMTYYPEEIKDIDGEALSLEAPKAPEASRTVPVSNLKEKTNIAGTETTAEKRALILKFIDVFGTRQAMISNFNAMLDSLAEQKPEEAQRIREKFKIDEVIERLIPSYNKHFTSEDLKSYIEFYSSEKGQKLTSSIGAVMQDSIEVGTAYLREKFPELENQ